MAQIVERTSIEGKRSIVPEGTRLMAKGFIDVPVEHFAALHDRTDIERSITLAAATLPKVVEKKATKWPLSKSDKVQLEKINDFVANNGGMKVLFKILGWIPFPIRWLVGGGLVVVGIVTTIVPMLPGSIIYLGPPGIAIAAGTKERTQAAIDSIMRFCDKYSLETIKRFVLHGRIQRKRKVV